MSKQKKVVSEPKGVDRKPQKRRRLKAVSGPFGIRPGQ